jgi:hypothetical protein
MAILSVLIYRQGLKDGQMVSKGEKIKTAPKIPLKTKESAEQKRIIKGLRNIISYGMGSDKK